MSKIEITDHLSELIGKYTYDEVPVQLIDIDGWDTEDLQTVLQIIDNEVGERCNNELLGITVELEDYEDDFPFEYGSEDFD